MEYLTDGFNTLALFSFSGDIPDAGSTCSASSMRPDDGLHKRRSFRNQNHQFHASQKLLYKVHFRENNELQKGSILLSSLAVTLIILSLIYSKPENFASGNKMGGKLQQSKDCRIYLCKN